MGVTQEALEDAGVSPPRLLSRSDRFLTWVDCLKLRLFLIVNHLVPDGASNPCSVATFAPIQRRTTLFTVTPPSLDPLILVIVPPIHILVVVPVVEVLDVAPVPPLLQSGLAPSPVLFSTARLIFASPLLA